MKHKDMLSVRLGTFKSNDEALEDYPDGADLIGTNMMGSDIDKLLIDREANRIQTYYEDQKDPKAAEKANQFKSSAMKAINEQFK